MPKRRIFIVAPDEFAEFDTRYDVCTTTCRRSLAEIYDYERFAIEDSFDNARDAEACAKKLGAKRPTII